MFESVGSIVGTVEDALGIFKSGEDEGAKGIISNLETITGNLSEGKGTLGKTS